MIFRWALLLLMTGVNSSVFSQFGNVWAFGYHHGLDFSNGYPQYIDTTAIMGVEGSATFCDSSGRLLLYTDGNQVFNRHHQRILNDDSMSIGISHSAQSAFIVQKSGNQFYLFTTDAYQAIPEPLQLKYHIIDLDANNGQGAIILKNQVLAGGVSEKLTGTRHCNGRDWWIVVKPVYTDEYLSFLVTPDSIISSPVISSMGISAPEGMFWSFGWGCMKISPNGKLIGTCFSDLGIQLGRFDNSTGVISNTINDFLPTWRVNYGCSFSADSKQFYFSNYFMDSLSYADKDPTNDIYLARIERLSTGEYDSNSVLASRLIYPIIDSVIAFSALQLGPDGNIYARAALFDTTEPPQMLRDMLYYIKPGVDEVLSTNIHFVKDSLTTAIGFPNFPDAIFTNRHTALLKIQACGVVVDSIFFYDSLLTVTRDYSWNFDDENSDNDNYSDLRHPTHEFTSPGTYHVILTLESNCNPIVIEKDVVIPDFSQEVPTISMADQVLIAQEVATEYQWLLNGNNIQGETSPTFQPVINGNYSVEVTNQYGCSATSSIFQLLDVGLADYTLNQFVIYPNPAQQSFTLQCNSAMEDQPVSIFNVAGQQVYSGTLTHEPLIIEGLAEGMYFVKVGKLNSKKLVVIK